MDDPSDVFLSRRKRDSIISDLTKTGLSREEIADKAGCTPDMVSRRRKALGLVG